MFIVPAPFVTYIRRAMQEFHPGEWCFDPYAKQCERCDTVIARYAVMTDDRTSITRAETIANGTAGALAALILTAYLVDAAGH